MKLTMEEACTVIEQAKILKKPDGTHPTAREIYEYSPTGELVKIWEWYTIAKEVLAKRNGSSPT